MKKTILFTILSLFLTSKVLSQEFEVPPNVVLESVEDFSNYEIGVVQAYNWLLKTPIDENITKRKEVSAFILKWLEGSPSVTVQIDPNIVTFLECSDCLLIFMGGWTIHTLNNNYDKDPVKGATAGILGVIDFYQNNKTVLGKNKNIEKYIKLNHKGKLESYISSKM